MLTVGSLFSGIGGLDLGLERAKMTIRWQSEIDPYACKILKKHWPEVPNHGDIKQIDWRTVEPVDVICGGYPCQPFSTAGKRRGTDDPRHLWPWVRDAISALRPRYAILENVRGHLSLGGSTVIGELAEIGYDAEWRVISAAGLGAPHRRDRIFIVAYPTGSRLERPEWSISQGNGGRSTYGSYLMADTDDTRERAPRRNMERKRETNLVDRFDPLGESRGRGADMADSDGEQLGERGLEENTRPKNRGGVYNGGRQTEYDGWKWWETEPDVGRVADGIPSRVDRLRGLGNAVVPQVAEYIGRLVMAAELDNA